MAVSVITDPKEVCTYLARVRHAADSDRNALGFLPKSAYQDQAEQGRLWVAAAGSGRFCGYLLFGGTHRHLRVFQLFVDAERRGAGVGIALVRRLKDYGVEAGALTIVARVAAALPANGFWAKMGFRIARQERTRATSRLLNVRVFELPTPSLFPPRRDDAIDFGAAPILRDPSYAIDLNVFFDVVKQRSHAAEGRQLLGAAMAHRLRVFVTHEFVRELERKSIPASADPSLEFARCLPVLARPDELQLQHLSEELRIIVYAARSQKRTHASQDRSDLVHLASCIHHGLSGFITRDRAILRCRNALSQRYGLDVISPTDLAVGRAAAPALEIRAGRPSGIIAFERASERDRVAVSDLLKKRGSAQGLLEAVWPRVVSPGQRILTIYSDRELVGLVSQHRVPATLPAVSVALLLDETRGDAAPIVDHVLEAAIEECPVERCSRIELLFQPDQETTRETADYRGYRPAGEPTTPGLSRLDKAAFVGTLGPGNWNDFVLSFGRLTGIELPASMPTSAEFEHTGVLALQPSRARQETLSLFDFETLVGPAFVLHQGRVATLVPIRPRYAMSLGLGSQQPRLLADAEARLRIERSYFRKATRRSVFEKGGILVFYVSGAERGPQAAMGAARITSSRYLTVANAMAGLSRQGVLRTEELEAIAGSRDQLHAITFDNLVRFPGPIAYADLRKLPGIGGANFVTAERIPDATLRTIMDLGFRRGVDL